MSRALVKESDADTFDLPDRRRLRILVSSRQRARIAKRLQDLQPRFSEDRTVTLSGHRSLPAGILIDDQHGAK